MLDASTGASDRQLDVSDPDQRNKTVRSAAWTEILVITMRRKESR
jgi:hypothetical protein